MVGIYIITNLINGKRYIGQSIDIEKRFWGHRCISHETNVHLKRALKKYGKENFKYEVLEECLPEELDDREIYYISTLKPEYNVSLGGQGRKKRLPESVRKVIGQKSREAWARLSEEEKEQRRSLLRGRKSWNAGKHQPEYVKEKLRKANLGKRQSPETIEKRKQTFIRKKQNGYVQTNAGHKKKVVCLDTGEVFESVKAAGERFGIGPSGISANLVGKYKSCHGYHFEYLKSVETTPDECREVGRKMSYRPKCKAHESVKR